MASGASRGGVASSGGPLSWCIDLAVAVTVVSVFWLPSLVSADSPGQLLVGGVLGALVGASVILRWRFLLTAPVAALGGTLVGWLLGISDDPMLAVAWSVYPLAVRRAPQARLLGLVVVGTVLLFAVVVAVPASPSALGQRVVIAVAAVGGAWLLGLAEGRRIVAAQASEQTRMEQERAQQQLAIAREVHDVVGHALAVISAEAGVVRELPDADERELREGLADVEQHARSALQEVQGLVRTLRNEDSEPGPGGAPSGLATVPDMVAAARSAGIDVSTRLDMIDLPPAVDAATTRIVQESLSNVIRHAGATACSVAISARDGGLAIQVEDNGKGLTADVLPGFGLRGMRERTEDLGGSLSWRNRPEGGTQVLAWLPLGAVS